MICARRCVLTLLLVWLPMAACAEPAIVGSWVLVEVAPQPIMNTLPSGIGNVKMHFTADGQLFVLAPDAASLTGAERADYRLDGQTLIVNGRPMRVSFAGDDTLLISQPGAAQRTLKRLTSYEQRLEPLSLERVIEPTAPTGEVAYDSGNYAGRPLAERLLGIWEVVAYEHVPRSQAPPYGFFNDLWTVTRKTVTIAGRAPAVSDSTAFTLAHGRLGASGIALGGPVGSRVEWTPSFNEWGQLVLDGPDCRVILKLVSKDPAAAVKVPVKVVNLRLQD